MYVMRLAHRNSCESPCRAGPWACKAKARPVPFSILSSLKGGPARKLIYIGV